MEIHVGLRYVVGHLHEATDVASFVALMTVSRGRNEVGGLN